MHTALDPGLYVDPGVARPREQEAIFARTWQLAGHVSDVAEPGRFLTAQVGARVRARRPRPGRRAARVPQRLPPPRRPAARGSRRLRQGDPLPVPRLDLPHRRRADRRARGPRVPRPRQDAARPDAGQRRDLRRPRVRQPRPGRRAARADARPASAERLAPYGIERLERFSESSSSQPANWKIVADNYLEGYHVPIAHPGLMRLLDYQNYDVEVGDGYVLFEAPLRDKPSGNRLERAYQKMVRPMPGPDRRRQGRLALHVHLAQHDDRHVPRPGEHLADQPAGDRRHPRRLGAATGAASRRRPCAPIQRLNHRLNNEVADGGRRARRPGAGGDGHDAAGAPARWASARRPWRGSPTTSGARSRRRS